jgi:hypothetical protein
MNVQYAMKKGTTYFLQGLSKNKPRDPSADDDNMEFFLPDHIEL